MIKNKSDYEYYVSRDLKIRHKDKKLFYGFRNDAELIKYTLLMRKVEYYNNCKKGLLNKIITLFLKFNYKRKSIKYGFSIPINTFGPGVLIVHRGTIVINNSTTIGENCIINSDVNIGTNMGKQDEAPVLGNNVFLGPGAKLFGKITIGNNVAIGANCVVNKDVPDNVTVAGIPFKIVNNKGTLNRIDYNL